MASKADNDKDVSAPSDGRPTDRQPIEAFVLALVETCVRNTQLEFLHAGRVPRSATGDYSDVTVVTPFGEIPWNNLSRISDSEMKSLMIEIVDKMFTVLQYPDELTFLGAADKWDRPKLDEALMRIVRRRRGEAIPFSGPASSTEA